jgi:hypothetical protein
MTLEIQVLAWDRHNNVMGGLRQTQQCDGRLETGTTM